MRRFGVFSVVFLLFITGCGEISGLFKSKSDKSNNAEVDSKEIEEIKYRSSIKSVLDQDESFMRTKVKNKPKSKSYQQAVGEYVVAMRSINLSKCPPEFREVFVRHIYAWDSVGRFESSSPDELEAFLMGVIDAATAGQSGLTAEALKEDAAQNKEWKRRLDEVHRTFGEVEAIAARYGAFSGR